MVDADLRKPAPVEQIKRVLKDLRCVSEKLFVVQSHLHQMVAQAFALGATAVVSRPREIISKLEQIEITQKASQAGFAAASTEITDGAAGFASMFLDGAGRPLKLPDAESATAAVINGIEQNGLGVWLDDVRRYHQGTFQHCLLVTGVAVGFADAWDEHEAYLVAQGQHDRAAYMEHKALELNVAICNAIANKPLGRTSHDQSNRE